MSYSIARHAHMLACMRHCTRRLKASQHRDAKFAKRKVLRLRARDEIANGLDQLEDERDEQRARLTELEHDAEDVCDSDSDECDCRARQRRALEELAALRAGEGSR